MTLRAAEAVCRDTPAVTACPGLNCPAVLWDWGFQPV